MEEYVITSIASIIFGIICGIIGYKGYWGKYGNLAQTIYNALSDGSITEEEIEEIKKAWNDTKKE